MLHNRKCTLLLAAALLLLLAQTPAAQARINRASIACSMYVDPCHCGLCPRIVDCSKTPSAECFCGTTKPGVYPHPSDPSKFWMCSHDTQTHISYGVEVPCPARLVFDPVVKVCTVPAAMSPAPSKQTSSEATPPPPTTPAPKPAPTAAAGGSFPQGTSPVGTTVKPAAAAGGGAGAGARRVEEERGPAQGAAYRVSMLGSLRVTAARTKP